jgi:hypothetical protein
MIRPDRPTIGVDFDNTLARYDELLRQLLREHGWVADDPGSGKRGVRDAVRRLPNGENRWRALQAQAYGARILEAPPMEGAKEFLAKARAVGALVYVVSHKTRTAVAEPSGPDLHTAARRWLEANGFFDDPIGLDPEAVFFEDDRRAKVARIASLQCTHFVDDLDETFAESTFPSDVVRVLLNGTGEGVYGRGVHVCRTWDEVEALVLGS